MTQKTSQLPPASRLILAAMAALCAFHHASAQPTATATDSAALAKYDRNKNGVLDADEAAAMRADESRSSRGVQSDGTSPEKAVELSPFTVDAGGDKGYYGANALSGTRLNTKIEDLASSITVITKQQLLDTASVDLNDIFLYEANTEGTGQFTDPTNDGRGSYDNVAGSPSTSNRIRGLNAANIAVNGFTSTPTIPIDTYNVDSIEISRGPNSSIFGLGDASGTVNINRASANTTRQSNSVTVRGDSYGGFRSSLDVNRPLIRDVLAVRVSMMYEEKGYIRKPSTDRTERGQLAFTYRPFKDTKISGAYEAYHNFNSRANSEPPRDTIAYWRAHGRPTWNPLTQVATVNGIPFNAASAPITNDANLPAGLAALGTTNVRLQQLIDAGQVLYLAAGKNPAPAAGTTPNVGNTGIPLNTNQRLVFSGTDIQRGGGGIFGGVATPLYNMPETTDKSIYDWEDVNLAAANYNRMRADIFTLTLEQLVLNTGRNTVAFQAGWYREDSLEYRRSFVAQQDGVPAILQLDTNEVLLDGTPNPFFLRPFIGGNEPQVFKRPVFNDNYRAMVAYRLDLRKEKNAFHWLGMHQVSAYGEYRQEMKSPNGLRFRDQVIDNTDFVSATNVLGSNGGHLYPRYFLGNTKGGGVEYANRGPLTPDGQYKAAFVNASTGVFNNADPVNIQEVYFSQGMQKKKVRTEGIALQSYLLNDQVIPTVGVRKDRLGFTDSLPLVAGPNGLFDTKNLYNYGVNKKWNKGQTTTKGIVVRPFERIGFLERARTGGGVGGFLGDFFTGLGFYYNTSDSFQPADIAYNVFGDVLPNPTGKGKDYGVQIRLSDKFYLKVNKYDTFTQAARSTLGTIAGRAVRLDYALSSTGNPDNFSLFPNAIGWYTQLHPEWTPAQVQDAASKLTGITPARIAAVQNKSISDVNDAQSKGWEVEMNYNPSRYWTVKATGTQQVAIDSNLSHHVQDYIDERLPIWTTVIDPVTGLNWWTENNNAASNFYIGSVLAPLKLGITTQGKPKPQTREYSFNFTTNYQLAGLFQDNRYLRNASVGGSFRWASKGAIGFYGAAPDTDGQVRSLNGARPIYDDPTTNLDLLMTYNLKLFNDRVRTRLQLNVRNVTESGRLQPIAVNPDGQVWRYRIVDPRQFILTASFDL